MERGFSTIEALFSALLLIAGLAFFLQAAFSKLYQYRLDSVSFHQVTVAYLESERVYWTCQEAGGIASCPNGLMLAGVTDYASWDAFGSGSGFCVNRILVNSGKPIIARVCK